MTSDMRGPWRVFSAATAGSWRDRPGRFVLAALGIALGVALGVAVHLINSSAAQEFDAAVRSLSGEADVLVRGPRSGFPDSVYLSVARLEGVRTASPAVEVEAQLSDRRETLKVLGLDLFRAIGVQPHLFLHARRSILFDLFKPDTALLSSTAAQELGLKAGDTLRLRAGTSVVALKVLDILPEVATQQRLAIMDIANAQWRLGRLGELHRIDIKLESGVAVAGFRERAAAILPQGVLALTPEAEAERNVSLTRAYRTNLDMLALVALLTGSFLVFSTQFLALLRRRTQLALLRVLGLTRTRLLRLLIAEGAALGLAGSALGVTLGCILAQAVTAQLGGDLGAGYFRSVIPDLKLSIPALATYFVLGVAFSVLGAAVPAFEVARRQPALALKAGDEEAALERVPRGWPGIALLAAGGALSQAPPVLELPIFGYASIALLLIGTIVLMPAFAQIVLRRLRAGHWVPAQLATAQLQATPRQVAVSVAGIVASFSLMVSMLVMTLSFRTSLDAWLDRMLPADLYVRAARLGETGYFTPKEQQRIANVPGVEAAIFVRSQSMLVREDRPAITLLARTFVDGRPHPPLPVESREVLPSNPAPPPVWLSEIAAELLHASPGATVELPIAGAKRPFTVAGIWRDYGRQNGAAVIDRALYISFTGDERANEAAVYLIPGVAFTDAARRVRGVFPEPDNIEIAASGELKALSLSIFDRTFAITYALEIAAVLIGLFGISVSFSAQALARRREFGVLRHIGMTRTQIAGMLCTEGLIVSTLGVMVGLVLGWGISLILVHVINRQSFHWSMDMHLPWEQLSIVAVLLVGAATLTAVFSGRGAMTSEVTRAVREDW